MIQERGDIFPIKEDGKDWLAQGIAEERR